MIRHALLLSSAFALAAPLQAQETAGTSEDLFGGDIVVTAQKTEQRLADVPVTISALTGEQLKRIGVNQLDQLSAFVPGLNFQEQSPNNPGFVIRGITSGAVK